MFRNAQKGDRVRVLSPAGQKSWTGNKVLTCDFDRSRGDTGTIKDVQRGGGSTVTFIVALDPPNFGELWVHGTKNLERAAEPLTAPVPVSYDPDCPACLRGRAHTLAEHESAVSRATK